MTNSNLSSNPLGYVGIDFNQNPTFISANRAPTSQDLYVNGTRWEDGSASPKEIYTTTGAGVWVSDNLDLSTDATFAGALDTTASSSLAIKTYADSLTFAGAPNASNTVKGIVEIATNAEAVAGTGTGGTGAILVVSPSSIASVMASPGAIGGTTPAAGSFSTLAASGLASLSGSATILSGGTAINIGSDASADAINVGTGAAARVITIGNITGASQVVLNSGTAGIALASTGAGDITLDSDDTLLLDADGVLELNSSGGVISIGNDADAQNINLGTGAAARVITIGNNSGATDVSIESGSAGVNIATAASAQSVSIGNVTGASAISMSVGTGNFSLDGVTNSTYTVGASTTTGTIDIGGTAQTGNITLGSSSGTNALRIANGAGATTVSIAAVQVAGAVNVGTAMTTGTITIGGTGLQTGTVSIAPGTGAQAVDIATGGTGIKTVSIATGAVANVVNIGSASAGAIAVDTAAGLSLDAATASNFTVSGATEDLTLQSSAGRVIIKGEEAAASAVELVSAAGGISASSALQLSLISSQAAVADSVRIQSSAADGGIDIDSGTGGLTIDSTGAYSIDGAAASNVSVSGAGIDLTLASAAGRVIVNGEEAAANAITLLSAAGGVDLDAALEVNIASSQAASSAITLSASNASGGITHTGRCVYTPDAITSDNAGVAASVSTVVTEITTDGDSNLDNVTLAAGVDGQVKIFAIVAVGNAADSVKITPSSLIGGTQITFAANPLGLGCQMYYDAGVAGWVITGNNGGVIA